MMKFLLMASVVLFSAFPARAYSSLEELMADMSRRELEALREYVSQNPQAADFAEARQMLVYRLMSEMELDEAVGYLETMYNEMPADKTGVGMEDFGEVIIPTLQLYHAGGKTNELVAFIEKVRKDFSAHEQAEIINSSLDDFIAMLNVDRPEAGEPLDITFTAIDDREVAISAMTGRVVLVDFWATWCGPCVKAMPAVKQLYEDYHADGLEIVGISLDSEREDLDAYLARESIPWPQYFDGQGWENEFAVRFGIESIPATYLLGPDGKIVAINASDEELRTLIPGLLGSAAR